MQNRIFIVAVINCIRKITIIPRLNTNCYGLIVLLNGDMLNNMVLDVIRKRLLTISNTIITLRILRKLYIMMVLIWNKNE